MEFKGIKIFQLILFIIIRCVTFSQEPAKEEEKLFANNRYSLAWPYYENLLKKDSLNTELNYKMGICYLNSRSQKGKAVAYLKKALKDTLSTSLSSATLYHSLAEASYHSANYDLAIENFEKYKKTLIANKKDSNEVERINHKIEICKLGKEIKQLKGVIASLADNNKQLEQSSSSVDPSTRSLTFKMPPDNTRIFLDADFFDDTSIALRLNSATQRIQNPDTSDVLKEATIATSVDGQIILIYRNDKGVCNLYASHLEGNNWTNPERLNKIINTKGWEPDEFISADGNTLYFASERPGGFGGKDIYKSVKLSNGEWSKAYNLGAQINTPYDDEAPFIHPDGVTLYYSTKTDKKKAGYNIYTSCLSDNGTWSEAKSIGYPINQPSSSAPIHHEGSFSEKENYITTFLNQKKTPLTLIKGRILDKNGKPTGYTEITVTNETGEVAGIYHSDEQTGQFIFILPPNKSSTITYNCDGYLFHVEGVNTSIENYYKINKTIELSPLIEGSCEMLNTFSLIEDKVSPASAFELNTLTNFLKKNPGISIEVFTYQGGKKSAKGIDPAEYVMQVVKNFLVDKGINKDRIEIRQYKKVKKKSKKEIPDEKKGIGIKINKVKQTIYERN